MISKERDYLFVLGEDKSKIRYGKDVMPLRTGHQQDVLRGLDIVFLMEAFCERRVCSRLDTDASDVVSDGYRTFGIKVSNFQLNNINSMYVGEYGPTWISKDARYDDTMTELVKTGFVSKWIEENRYIPPTFNLFRSGDCLIKQRILDFFAQTRLMTRVVGHKKLNLLAPSMTINPLGNRSWKTQITVNNLIYREGSCIRYREYGELTDISWYEYPLTVNQSEEPVIDKSQLPGINTVRYKLGARLTLGVSFLYYEKTLTSAGQAERYIYGRMFFDVTALMVTWKQVAEAVREYIEKKLKEFSKDEKDENGPLGFTIDLTTTDGGHETSGWIEKYVYPAYCDLTEAFVFVDLGSHTKWW